MSGSTGYPWLPGQVLTAADLNEAIQLSSGPTGPMGPPGADSTVPGPPGVGIIAGNGVPAGTQPVGTLYIDALSGDLYQFT